MKSIEETTIYINSIRQKGGSFSYGELASLLNGFPYSRLLPYIMRNHNVKGYSIIDNKIVFDVKHSIYIKTIELFIEEAKNLQSERNKSSNKLSPIQRKQMLIKKCIELYYNGESKEVFKLMKRYEKK